MTLRIFSFGGGVQSTAALVLATQERVQYDAFLFCNVGEDSENPETLAYFREHAQPFAQRHGIAIHELQRRNGRTLYQQLVSDNRTIDIPVRMSNGAPGNRNCTKTYKVQLVARWCKQHGASADDPATVGLGISTDEAVQRMRGSRIEHIVNEWPLVDLNMRRSDCINVIEEAGLPVPPKSACWFCPMKRPTQWQDMRREQPELFDQAVELERRLNEKRQAIGRDAAYIHRACIPLDEAVGMQGAFFEQWGECDSGHCMT